MNRRRCLYAAATGALATRVPGAFGQAPKYDLVIRGGRVIDPSVRLDAIRDVALLELREGNFEFLDNYGNKVPGRQRLFPSGTVLGGKWITRA